ncbi:MAG: hypothetical protein C0624_05090 [Desulfuromonas sp.]|nr:MAG: hypothetical protein C0624_05090 [Desulfuromonas sp.]
MKKSTLVILALLVMSASGIGMWTLKEDTIPRGKAAMAEYRIDKLSCGSCVNNIKEALAQVAGVGSVEINLTSNRGQVVFDPQQIDSDGIAKAISVAGYPAKLRTELSPQEWGALQEDQAHLGQQYLARIGDRLVDRTTFMALVEQRAHAAPDEQNMALKRVLWDELVQRELMLYAAQENGVTVQNGEVERRLEEIYKQHPHFEEMLVTRYPDRQALHDQLRDDMIIQRNLENNVYAGIVNPQQRQQRLNQWFAELQKSTDVVIFDPEIKALSTAGSGCGGSCCG